LKLNQKMLTLIKKAKVARLATVDQKSHPFVIPVVFVFHENSFFIPLDEKTKTVIPRSLKRVKNIEKNPNVTLLIDKYQNEWKKFFFFRFSSFPKNNSKLILYHFKITQDNVNIERSFKFSWRLNDNNFYSNQTI